MNKILQGDCIEKLKELESDSIDLICTDPPYGIGFMGKEWDTFKPETIANRKISKKLVYKHDIIDGVKVRRKKPEWVTRDSGARTAGTYDTTPSGAKKFREWFTGISIEMLRVLKPGAFAFVCIGARQDSVSAVITAMTEAGFKTDFTSLFWTYASGFPKAMNISKMVDKRLGVERERTPSDNKIHLANIGDAGYKDEVISNEPISDQAKALDGSYGGFQPKPAVEVIIVAMKPLSEKTYVDQALKNGKGITWLDDCRIPAEMVREGNTNKSDSVGYGANSWQKSGTTPQEGRFPANLLVSDDMLNDGINHIGWTGQNHNNFNPYGGNSLNQSSTKREGFYKGFDKDGSYSRYFDLDKWASTLPFLIVPKASKSEKNRGLEISKEKNKRPIGEAFGDGHAITGHTETKGNSHPTVKPLKLMSYLLTLGSREGDTILDPFAGSCTTLVAAKELKRNYIGIEREGEYVKICEARLDAVPQTLF